MADILTRIFQLTQLSSKLESFENGKFKINTFVSKTFLSFNKHFLGNIRFKPLKLL